MLASFCADTVHARPSTPPFGPEDCKNHIPETALYGGATGLSSHLPRDVEGMPCRLRPRLRSMGPGLIPHVHYLTHQNANYMQKGLVA